MELPENTHTAAALTSSSQTANQTQRGEFKDVYIMVHHNKELWSEICTKLKEIIEPSFWKNIYQRRQQVNDPQGEIFEDFIEVVSYFMNDEKFQTNRKKNRKEEQKGKDLTSEYVLGRFFEKLTNSEKIAYKEKIIPGIIRLILQTEELFPENFTFPILKRGDPQKITLKKSQCACLLAHMTMCITRDQNLEKTDRNFKLLDTIDFSDVYSKPSTEKYLNRKLEKLFCLFTYFDKFLSEDPEGNVVFERCLLQGDSSENAWKDCDEPLMKAEILAQGSIEETRDGLQVVFSDKNMGDQVLKLSMTQQGIMSLIHPELILSLLFCEELQSDEAVRVYGAERYSHYIGYESSFEFTGGYRESKKIGREHVIIDAEKYHSGQKGTQFAENYVLRELNKAFVGFEEEGEEGNKRKVASGKWGCGVFRGNPQLKFMIQWLAASRAGRNLVFYTFGDTKNFREEDVKKILKYYQGKNVEDLFKDLMKASYKLPVDNIGIQVEEADVKAAEDKNLFEFLINEFKM